MSTAFAHRLLAAIPASRQAAMITWWDNNLEPGQGANTWNVGLSATGSAPATAYWCSVALQPADCVTILRQLAQMASITVPTVVNLNTKAKVVAWIQANGAAIQAAVNIRIVRDDNDSTWTDPDTLLAAAGLQRIASVTP